MEKIKQKIKSILTIVNLKTLIVMCMALLSTYVCLQYKISAEFPLALISTAIVFPIVFSIAGAYTRRENALNEYADMKGHGKSIYFATRDWLEKPNTESVEKIRGLLEGLMANVETLFTGDVKSIREREKEVYKKFSEVSLFIRNDLRLSGALPSGEVSRCNQYLSKMMNSFERLKHIYQYRTPRTLRAFSDVFVTILPPLYGPYFAYIAIEHNLNLLAYLTPALFAFVLVSLDNIQSHLENPFDKIGEDDISLNVTHFIDRLQ